MTALRPDKYWMEEIDGHPTVVLIPGIVEAIDDADELVALLGELARYRDFATRPNPVPGFDDEWGYPEAVHETAVDLLLAYIGDARVREAFAQVTTARCALVS